MRNITVHKIKQPSENSQFLVTDSTLSENPEVLGKVEMTVAELMVSSFNSDSLLRSKVYDLVVEKLGGDIEYSIKLSF
jgi:hypothetical protein